MTLPNKLTVGRLALAGIFFVALVLAERPGRWPPGVDRRLLLNVAFVLFVVAGVTDILDGWIARRWELTSDFGRVADPFTDKVMTCGSFIFLATMPIWPGQPEVFVPAWVVVLVVGREFLVTGLRGFIESKGQQFGAMVSGKLKMFTQCFAIGAAFYTTANLSHAGWALLVTRVSVWGMLVITLISGAAYVTAARRILRENL